MKVYDMQADGINSDWVWLYAKNKLALPESFDDCARFFQAHRTIAVERNADFMPVGSPARLADYSNLSLDVHPVFSERARLVFEPLLRGLGEWIELKFDEAPYWLFFITNIVDALDEPASELKRFPDSGKVMRIASYAFRPEVVRNQFLFTLPQQPSSDRLVTDRFVDLVREHRLTGFMFQRLWSSETGPEPSGVKDWLKPRITGLEPV